jgi:deoxyribodipyrimidine photo-lyase
MKTNCVLLWLRKDLRLADNPALRAAMESGGAVVPVFIWSPDEEKPWPPGGASKWWLAQSLRALDESLRAKGSRLIVRQGSAVEVLRELVQETGASAVFWNRRYEPAVIERDKQIKHDLVQRGCRAESFNGSLLWEPWEIQNGSGKPFQVYTPFWKACLRGREVPEPLPTPRQILAPTRWPQGEDVASLSLEPSLAWADGFAPAWSPGEAGAQARLRAFTQSARAQKAPIESYEDGRNVPSQPGTSRLSPSLHFGELSPRQAWHAVLALEKSGTSGAVTYLKELVW